MSLFLNLVVTGFVSGAIYSLIGACLTLSYQTTGIFNLGYGAVAFTSAYIYYMLHVGLSWPIVPVRGRHRARVCTCAWLGAGPTRSSVPCRLLQTRPRSWPRWGSWSSCPPWPNGLSSSSTPPGRTCRTPARWRSHRGSGPIPPTTGRWARSISTPIR